MYWESPLFLILSTSGLGIVIVILIVIKYPPKGINTLYGYRTGTSMKSQERWDFAQRYSSKAMLVAGLVLTALSIPALFVKINNGLGITISLGLLLLSMAVVIYLTEMKLKSRFGKD